MPAKVLAPAHIGIDGQLVEVECDISNGLPAFIVVGLGDKAVDEARDRVRSALRNSRLVVPPKRITVNLAPADLPKDGTAYDLSLAISILIASEQVDISTTTGHMFFGELALDGSLRPVPGVLSYIQLAREQGVKSVVVPASNAEEAALLPDVEILPASTLYEVYRHLVGEMAIIPVQKLTSVVASKSVDAPDFADIYGQQQAKRAMEIAAAGGHNILMSGPPGAGKTLLSKALVGILPPPTLDETIEITKLHSLAGRAIGRIVTERPFRSPHHTASSIALIGGGSKAQPGEISLSHRGVLFLDELPEFPRNVLEALRQPLEDGQVTVARAQRSITYPAKFMLVATQNPCPCGHAGDDLRDCSCSPAQIIRYNRKISGPLMDRIDLSVSVGRVDTEDLGSAPSSEPTHAIAARVAAARKVQAKRFKDTSASINAEMDNRAIQEWCQLDEPTQILAKQAVTKLQLSARAYMRLLKVARTIADLAAAPKITSEHLAEALQYRAA